MAKRTKRVETAATESGTGEIEGTSPPLRRCIGSKRYGIDRHEAPVEDFPVQPSQKDGLGRMCAVHWRVYTSGLARDAKARKAAAVGVPAGDAVTAQDGPAIPNESPQPASPARAQRAAKAKKPIPGSIRTKAPRPARAPKVVPAAAGQGDAG